MIFKSLAVLFFLSWLHVAYADNTAVPQLKAIAGRLDRFLQSSPYLYDVQSHRKSPTGIIIFSYQVSANSFKFDAKKTESLVTPIIGKVNFNLSVISARSCGTIELGTSPENMERAAASMDEAQELLSKKECWKNDKYFDACSVQLTYGYTDSTWELRSIDSNPNGCTVLLNTASSRPMPGRKFVEENNAWKNINFGLPNRQ